MKMNENNRSNLTEIVSKTYSENGLKRSDLDFLNKIPIHKKESIMIIDVAQQKVVFSKGFKGLLGYDDDKITLDLILSSWHLEDRNIVERVGKATIAYSLENPINSSSYMLLITFRRKKSDGSYIKILSKSSTYKTDKNGNIRNLFIKYTDVSFMCASDVVHWNFEIDNLDKAAFRQNIYKAYADFFTDREIDIIQEIEKGYTNGSISENLNISKYTVETHRKNIFKKSNSHSTEELLFFCKRKGIL